MSLFEHLFKSKGYTRHADSFALTRDSLWCSIADAIKVQQEQGKIVFLISHFLDSFSASQSLVETNRLNYEILGDPISEKWVREIASQQPKDESSPNNVVHLALSDLLVAPAEPFAPLDIRPKFALMVIEVHPLAQRDQQLAEFAKALPGKVELGYFMALEDEVLTRTVSKEAIDVLRQLGLGDHDLITSNLISKRLKKLLKLQTEKVIEHQEANSAKEWYELHDADLA